MSKTNSFGNTLKFIPRNKLTSKLLGSLYHIFLNSNNGIRALFVSILDKHACGCCLRKPLYENKPLLRCEEKLRTGKPLTNAPMGGEQPAGIYCYGGVTGMADSKYKRNVLFNYASSV